MDTSSSAGKPDEVLPSEDDGFLWSVVDEFTTKYGPEAAQKILSKPRYAFLDEAGRPPETQSSAPAPTPGVVEPPRETTRRLPAAVRSRPVRAPAGWMVPVLVRGATAGPTRLFYVVNEPDSALAGAAARAAASQAHEVLAGPGGAGSSAFGLMADTLSVAATALAAATLVGRLQAPSDCPALTSMR